MKPVVEPYKKRMGFLPNALKLYAHRPEIAETLWRLNSNIMRDPTSTLDQLLKRKLAAVACATNGCAYCTAHSCSMLKKPKEAGFEGWGLSEAGAAGHRHRRLRAEKRHGARLLRLRPRPPPRTRRRCRMSFCRTLKKHLTPPQIVELACVVGFWKFYNAVHDSLHIPVESQLLGDTGYVNL